MWPPADMTIGTMASMLETLQPSGIIGELVRPIPIY